MLNFECPILNVEVKTTVWLVRCTGAFHFKIQPSAFNIRHSVTMLS